MNETTLPVFLFVLKTNRTGAKEAKIDCLIPVLMFYFSELLH